MINDLSFDSPYTALSLVGTSGGTASALNSGMNALPPAGTSRFDDPVPIDDTMQVGTGVYAAIWTGFTVSSGAVLKAVDDDLVAEGGSAWLTLEGTTILSGAMLFGTDPGVWFDGAVEILATSNAKIGNLGAGAGSGGAVAGVKLTIDSATLEGVSYAGGFGDVGHYGDAWIKDDVHTYVKNGVFGKDFYAGSLANYAKTGEYTDIRNVTLTIDSGSFGGNLYGASAVKVGNVSGTNIHSVQDVNITINGGAAQTPDFCLFGGGYATGSTGANVYAFKSVTLNITGGDWGEACGGRGIFGGVMASGVAAGVAENLPGDVNISISGGTMGNVFGGGWAQQGGVSEVGDVNISISGGTIANVIGGGSHSGADSGGATTADDVKITVSGGDITGDIYARGHLNGDSVAGTAGVIITGGNGFSCGVFGYSYVGGVASDATLSFSNYSGTFSGALGGFSGVTFDGTTAMTLATAATDVLNTAWNFDFTGRTDAGTSLLTWNNADFANDTVSVKFTDATQAKGGWSIATAAFDATTTFDLYIAGEKIAENIAYDTAISGGDWAGWKFTSVGGTLKFANLA